DEAIVTPYVGTDAPIRAPGHEGSNALDPSSHLNQISSSLEDIPLEALAEEVSNLRELSALETIHFERVSAERLVERVHEDVQRSYPPETQGYMLAVFSLLGFFDIPHPDWADLMASLELAERVAWVNESGDLIEVLDTASTTDPFTRLELVKEISDALARQHFPTARPPSQLHEDSSRAREGIRQGNKSVVAFRYARQRNISPAVRPPDELFKGFPPQNGIPPMLDSWHWLPWETGPFFVEARIGATSALSRIDELFIRPPTKTLELFRPSLYDEENQKDALISPDFAESILSSPPVFSGHFGIGGLIPWMMGSLPVNQAKSIAGPILSDRYALWELPREGKILLLETRWPDEVSARRFFENLPSSPFVRVTSSSKAPFYVKVICAETEIGSQLLIDALGRK
ncbi:MAG: hypothetical protein AAGB06_07045, partial [Verrucomicrobiota bacterium]